MVAARREGETAGYQRWVGESESGLGCRFAGSIIIAFGDVYNLEPQFSIPHIMFRYNRFCRGDSSRTGDPGVRVDFMIPTAIVWLLPLFPFLTRAAFLVPTFRHQMMQVIPKNQLNRDQHRAVILALSGFSFSGAVTSSLLICKVTNHIGGMTLPVRP